MYSRTTLLAAASVAVAGMAQAAPLQMPQQPLVAREQISAQLHLYHYRLLCDAHFVRGHYVAKNINPSGRVVLARIDPKDGTFMGEILM